MMKKTLCSLFVLGVIAQICAMPAEHDAEKDVKGAIDQASGLKDEATKDATDGAKKLVKDATDGGNKFTGAAADAKNKGDSIVAKHGKDFHKRGTHGGIVSNAVKTTEEVGKKFADASVKVATDILHLFNL